MACVQTSRRPQHFLTGMSASWRLPRSSQTPCAMRSADRHPRLEGVMEAMGSRNTNFRSTEPCSRPPASHLRPRTTQTHEGARPPVRTLQPVAGRFFGRMAVRRHNERATIRVTKLDRDIGM